MNLISWHALTGWLQFLVLFFLPGAWISFTLPLARLPFWARFCAGAMLTPLVVFVQYYAARWAGLSFLQTVPVLVAANLPVLLLMGRARRTQQARVPTRNWLPEAAVGAALCVATMVPLYVGNDRIFTGHTWSYTDTVYAIARGDLLPDDPELAGYRMGYPVWTQSVHIALLDYATDSPPMLAFATHHLLYLMMTLAFAGALAGELGGGRPARLLTGFWLFFGTNTIGFFLRRLFPSADALDRYQMAGDWRYTPWVLKFFDMNTMPLALAIFVAVAYLLVREMRQPAGPAQMTHVSLLVLCASLLYPILLPAFLALLGCWLLAALFLRPPDQPAPSWPTLIVLSVGGVLVLALTFAEVSFLGAPRVVRGLVEFTRPAGMARKGIIAAMVLLPLLAGAAYCFRPWWRSHRCATTFLLLGGVASAALHSVFHLPYWDNEYKFIFTAATCLAPFAGLAVAAFLAGLPRPVAAGTTLVLLAVLVPVLPMNYFSNMEKLRKKPHPQLHLESFHVRMQAEEPLARVCDTVREETPRDTVLLTMSAAVHFPTFTARSIYVPPANLTFAGVNQDAIALVAYIKGFGTEVIDQRRAVLRNLYGDDDVQRAAAWRRILELRRPVVLLLEPQHGALRAWLQAQGRGALLFEDGPFALWLVPHD